MNTKLIGKYYSLEGFEWEDIPKFAIITGKNGVGKSQFLDLILNTARGHLRNSENEANSHH